MKLPTTLHQDNASASKRYDQLADHFSRFVKATNFFSDPRSHFPQVKVQPTSDAHRLEVKFAGTHLRFQFLMIKTDERGIFAKVVCQRLEPHFAKDIEIIGKFTFDFRGQTEFDSDDGDKLDIEFGSPEIILYFLQLAISKEPSYC